MSRLLDCTFAVPGVSLCEHFPVSYKFFVLIIKFLYHRISLEKGQRGFVSSSPCGWDYYQASRLVVIWVERDARSHNSLVISIFCNMFYNVGVGIQG